MNSFNTDGAAYGSRVKTNVSEYEKALRIKVKCAIWANTIVCDGSLKAVRRHSQAN